MNKLAMVLVFSTILFSGCASKIAKTTETKFVTKVEYVEVKVPVKCKVKKCSKPYFMDNKSLSYEQRAKHLKLYLQQKDIYIKCLETNLKLCSEN